MDTKIYEKTRYQNIYRNKKNKNYIIMISTPVKTSIATFNGKKIFDISEAVKIRDNTIIKGQKGAEAKDKESFDTLWNKYIEDCKYVRKQAYNTISRKEKTYNRYLKNKVLIKISKADKNYWSKFIDKSECSNQQKNQLIKTLKAFYNWASSEDVHIVLNNPVAKIVKYKEEKNEMKYWLPEELKKFFNTTSEYKNSENLQERYNAYIIYTLTAITFSIGDRIGETRALTFNCIDEENRKLIIRHSIDYDPNSKTFLKDPKNEHSKRIINISKQVIDIINDYKSFLRNEMKYNVNDESLLFFNYRDKRPYSDTVLRKKFYYFCEKANVKKIRMYDLRHTFTTTMMAEGYELYYISKTLGHSNYSTTVNQYGHLRDDIKDKMAKTTDKYL